MYCEQIIKEMEPLFVQNMTLFGIFDAKKQLPFFNIQRAAAFITINFPDMLQKNKHLHLY